MWYNDCARLSGCFGVSIFDLEAKSAVVIFSGDTVEEAVEKAWKYLDAVRSTDG